MPYYCPIQMPTAVNSPYFCEEFSMDIEEAQNKLLIDLGDIKMETKSSFNNSQDGLTFIGTILIGYCQMP